ncbi:MULTISPECIES: SDR family NAD(P)-dependent oxidoreductase [Dyadobacter]|uniref:SDR family NAD(P)-dependent oxidoreductase n=1 Tax=Dyadobacter chenhuakuii TaxID=2909339 RepID=A0A9X1QJB7_9BACT|nr:MULTISPECIES: SDR family NAD(P)-dependent oxidoreductase [Dyadobacter]MCE7073788.1 SDR family NAD(P)-dependent oxidoreductase [Dyadobacter sp. CY327]MCF2501347.1 SDR family NAD(P)-dependent oxidoreductase [Dyadobacter chenhuakuii]
MKTQKTWLITGGARGLGFELTKAVLASGDNVVATVRSKPQELAETLGNDGNLHVAILDVTSEEQAKAAVDAVQKRLQLLKRTFKPGMM